MLYNKSSKELEYMLHDIENKLSEISELLYELDKELQDNLEKNHELEEEVKLLNDELENCI